MVFAMISFMVELEFFHVRPKIRRKRDTQVLCTGPKLLTTHTNGDYWIQDNQQATTKTDVCDAETARFYFVKPLPLPQNP